MPIYEYKCDDCGSSFEKLVRRAGQDAGTECPSCGQAHVTRQLSTFAAHANGRPQAQAAPACPSGRCSTPGLCGMNN